MSNERSRTRAARAEAAQRRSAEQQTARRTAALERAKAARRAARWRRLRLWQRTSSTAGRREGWAALGTLTLVCLVLAYFLTGSLSAVLFTVLVLLIAMPALVMLTFDRRRR